MNRLAKFRKDRRAIGSSLFLNEVKRVPRTPEQRHLLAAKRTKAIDIVQVRREIDRLRNLKARQDESTIWDKAGLIARARRISMTHMNSVYEALAVLIADQRSRYRGLIASARRSRQAALQGAG